MAVGSVEAVIHHRIDTSVRAYKAITDDFTALSMNWSQGEINALKCVRVKIKIVTVSRLSLFF